jgi:hypothetical protein
MLLLNYDHPMVLVICLRVGMETKLQRQLLVGIMMLCLTRKNLYVDMLQGSHVDFDNWRRCKGIVRQNAMTRACQSLENTVM